MEKTPINCHNPYFSRWFSAMRISKKICAINRVTILILVDGFLQSRQRGQHLLLSFSHNPYFSRWFSAINNSKIGRNRYRISQSLFQQMVFCNYYKQLQKFKGEIVTILILVDGFLQYSHKKDGKKAKEVTILILVDGFLQFVLIVKIRAIKGRHNPYFSRWFSAIYKSLRVYAFLNAVTILILVDGFLQSISQKSQLTESEMSHNPYFSRWFSAIMLGAYILKMINQSQSLFQQMVFCNIITSRSAMPVQSSHNPYFSRWFSAIRHLTILEATAILSQSLFQQMVFCNLC